MCKKVPRLREHRNCMAGFSLVELLVAIGIMSIIMAGMASLGVSLYRENKALQQKLETIELEQTLARFLMDKSSCDCIFRGLTWDSSEGMQIHSIRKGCSSTPGINLIESGKPISEFGAGVEILRISLQNPTDIGGPGRSADLVVEFNQSSLVRPIRSLRLPSQSFLLSGSKVDSCMGLAGAEEMCGGMGGTWQSGVCRFGENKTAESPHGLRGIFLPHAGKTISCVHPTTGRVMAKARVLADGTPQIGQISTPGGVLDSWTDGVNISKKWMADGISATLTTSGLSVTHSFGAHDSGDSNGTPAGQTDCNAVWPLD